MRFLFLAHRYPADRYLRYLDTQLNSYLRLSRSTNTVRKYENYFALWRRWALQYDVSPIPTTDKDVALYLIALLQDGKTFHVISSMVYAIKWTHEISGFVDPISVYCHNLVECAKRHARPARNPKEPLSPAILRMMYREVGGESADLLQLRRFCILLLSFVAFLRYDELANLRRGDISVFRTHMSIFLEKSKTDTYRDGHTIVVSRLDSVICPVKVLSRYISRAHIVQDEEFLFRAVTWWKSKTTYLLRAANKPLSYSIARTDTLELVRKVGLDPNKFGLHSARSGGATSAANNGVPDRLFKRHGRWKSTKAKDAYVKDNLRRLLSVSQNLGL